MQLHVETVESKKINYLTVYGEYRLVISMLCFYSITLKFYGVET